MSDPSPHGTSPHDAPGRDAPGRDAPGRDAPGRDATGRDAPGRDGTGGDVSVRDPLPPIGAPDAENTVEAIVRHRLATFIGGWRGLIESAAPMIAFTAMYVPTHEVKLAAGVGVGFAVLLLAVRLVDRTPTRFVLNSLFMVSIAAFFALRSGRAEDAFLPGIITNSAYSIGLLFSILAGWPAMGFVIGAVTGDPIGWRWNHALVKVCTKLTWLLLLPTLIRVAVLLPLYRAGHIGRLGLADAVLGWPLTIASLAGMVWVLTRGRTPASGRETAV